MFCSKCGAEIEENLNFCGVCGAVVNVSTNDDANVETGTKSEKENVISKKHNKPKKKKKKLLLGIIIVVLIIAVAAGVFVLHNYMEERKYIKAVQNYANVNDAVTELAATESYSSAETAQKADEILELLDTLEDSGEILSGSVIYDEENQVIAYQYADGAYGGVMLESFAEGTDGGGESYVVGYTDQGLVSESDDTVSFDIGGYPYVQEDLSAIITYGLGYDYILEILKDKQEIWTEEYLQTELNEDSTAASYREKLKGYDLVAIREHGWVYKNETYVMLQETITDLDYILRNIGVAFTDEVKEYVDDVRGQRIAMVCMAADNKYHTNLTPEFFTYYYGDGQLDDAIVWLGCCEGYQNDSLVKAFADCGAKAVLGFTEEVDTFYGTCMLEAVVYMLLYGNTVDESVTFAKSVWGDNDKIFVENYYTNKEDNNPSELRYYNGGNETLVTLTEDGTYRIKDNSVVDNTSYDEQYNAKLQELIDEYGLFKSYQTGSAASQNTAWFDPAGVMGATIADFDSDGTDEMLVCISEYDDDNSRYHAIMYMYDSDQGKVSLEDSLSFGTYDSVSISEVGFSPIYYDWAFLSEAVLVDGQYYIFCQEVNGNTEGGGGDTGYWILKYVNNKFQYAGAFIEEYHSPTSGDLGTLFRGYTFESDVCKKTELYYSEFKEDNPLYTHFGKAISAFFNSFGIKIADEVKNQEYLMNPYDSVLSDDNEITLDFEFKNSTINQGVCWQIVATLEVGNETLNTMMREKSNISITDCYKDILSLFPEYTGDYFHYDTQYTLYDIDKDGIEELIVQYDNTYYYIYTFDQDMGVFCGMEVWTYYNCLYEYDGNGLIVWDGGNGNMLHEEYILLYSMSDGTIELNKYLESGVNVYDNLSNYTPISDFISIVDYTYLSD